MPSDSALIAEISTLRAKLAEARAATEEAYACARRSDELRVALVEANGRLRSDLAAARGALEKSRRAITHSLPHVCNALCPSVKKTGTRWIHHPICEELSAALAPVLLDPAALTPAQPSSPTGAPPLDGSWSSPPCTCNLHGLARCPKHKPTPPTICKTCAAGTGGVWRNGELVDCPECGSKPTPPAAEKGGGE